MTKPAIKALALALASFTPILAQDEALASDPTTFASSNNEANQTSGDNAAGLGEILITDIAGGGGGGAPTSSITDSLRSDSSVQFSRDSRSSATGGEIAPPRISIFGAQHYENNFMIGGVSNNNNLHPGGISKQGSGSLPTGEAQSLFIDGSLVESVTAHVSAISAEYGSFTGSVIDAKLKDARTDRWHFMAKYRHTQDDWAKFHLTDEQRNTDKSINANYQPEFNKQ